METALYLTEEDCLSSRHRDRMMAAWGRRLAASRLAAGFETAADMAREVKMEANAYRKYERGEAMAPIDMLELICKLTGKSLDFLLLGKPDRSGQKDDDGGTRH